MVHLGIHRKLDFAFQNIAKLFALMCYLATTVPTRGDHMNRPGKKAARMWDHRLNLDSLSTANTTGSHGQKLSILRPHNYASGFLRLRQEKLYRLP